MGYQGIYFWYSVEDTIGAADFIMREERKTLRNWYYAAKNELEITGKCSVLDIGSNGGFFSLFSRQLGCKVVAVDAQPWCLKRLSSAAAVNGITDNFYVKWGVVSDIKTTMDVGANKCSGLWSAYQGNSETHSINLESSFQVPVESITFSDLVRESKILPLPLLPTTTDTITIMKIDAEGSEMLILKAALPFLREHRILNVMVEIAPARIARLSSVEDVQFVFSELKQAGYKFFDVDSIGDNRNTDFLEDVLITKRLSGEKLLSIFPRNYQISRTDPASLLPSSSSSFS